MSGGEKGRDQEGAIRRAPCTITTLRIQHVHDLYSQLPAHGGCESLVGTLGSSAVRSSVRRGRAIGLPFRPPPRVFTNTLSSPPPGLLMSSGPQAQFINISFYIVPINNIDFISKNYQPNTEETHDILGRCKYTVKLGQVIGDGGWVSLRIGGWVKREGRPMCLVSNGERRVRAVDRRLGPGEALGGGVSTEGGGAKVVPRRGSWHGGDGREGGGEGCGWEEWRRERPGSWGQELARWVSCKRVWKVSVRVWGCEAVRLWEYNNLVCRNVYHSDLRSGRTVNR